MRRLVPSLAVVILVSACGGTELLDAPATTLPAPPSTTTSAPPETTTTPAPDNRPVYSGLNTESLPDEMTLVAMIGSDTPVYDSIGNLESSMTLSAETILGTPTVLEVVDGPNEGWALVRLPVRPNGSVGWIETDDAEIYVVEGRVVVDLSDKSLTYYENGEEVLSTTVAIGTSRNPTPVGEFFVTDNVTLADPNSPWGPHAFGISARSETITEYNGGDGIIGIHGTNKPGSIGKAASLGCVRVPNEVITELHGIIPIGTPVEINA
jgi:lipoprotein-anchoring transpeptidase ErfK/SrfK